MKLYYSEETVKLYLGDNAELFTQLKDKSDKLLTEGLRVAKTMIITSGGYTNVDYWKDECKKRNIEWFRFCWYKGAMSHRSKVGFAHWEEILIFGDMYAGIPDFI